MLGEPLVHVRWTMLKLNVIVKRGAIWGGIYMEINRLKTFLIIVKTGSFKSAAERLFLSPRAVSKQMDQLENELSVKLFVRQRNNTELTEQGKSFIVAAQDIVNIYDDELMRIQSEREKCEEKLKIGFSSANQEIVLQRVLRPFLVKHPHIKLEFQEESGRHFHSLLEKGALDFAIAPYYALDDFPNEKFTTLKQIELERGQLLVGISTLNQFAAKDSITLDKLADLPVYYYSPYESDFLQKVFLDKFGNYLRKDTIMRASSLEQRDIRVAANQGIGFFPSPFIEIEKQRNPMLNFLQITGDVNDFYSSTFYYNPDNDNPYLQELVSLLKSK